MADDVSLSFSSLNTNITGLCCNYVPRDVLKLNLWTNTHYIQAKMLHSEYISSILLLKWLTPSNGGSVQTIGETVLTRCSRSSILPTYTGQNHLKLLMAIYKSLYYESLLSIIINFLLFSIAAHQIWQNYFKNGIFSGSL